MSHILCYNCMPDFQSKFTHLLNLLNHLLLFSDPVIYLYVLAFLFSNKFKDLGQSPSGPKINKYGKYIILISGP